MCGYDFGAEKPTIFLPADFLLTKDGKLVESSELMRHILTHPSPDCLLFWANTDKPLAVPTNATNILEGKNPNVPKDMHRCPPLRIHLGEDVEWAADDKDISTKAEERLMKMLCLDLLKENLHLITEHTQYSEDQKEQILDYIRSISHYDEEIRLRRIKENTSPSQYAYITGLFDAHTAKQVPLCHSLENPTSINFTVIYKCARLDSLPSGVVDGDVFVDIFTKASGPLSAKPTDTMFGSVEKGCAFVERVLAVPTTAAASTAVGITTQQLATPEVFKAALQSFIHRRIEDAREGFAVTPALQFHPDHRTFQKSQFWYRSPTNNHVRTILNEIGESLGVVCKLRFVRGSTNARTTFQVESISWISRA
jgi:hypothetical protein